MAATSRAHFWERCGAFFSCSCDHCSGVGTSVSCVWFAVRFVGLRRGRASAGFRRGRVLRCGRVLLVWLTSFSPVLVGVVVTVRDRPRPRPLPRPRRGCGPTRAGAREAVDASVVTGGHHLGYGGPAGGDDVECWAVVV